jgi:adenylosuccinate lyase
MIPRYSRPEMMGIFDARNKLRIWLDVELAVAEEMAALGLVPKDAIAALGRNIAGAGERLIDPDRVDAIETVTRHDVIAFLTHVEEVCGPEARFLHLGMTSSDLLDTTLAIQLKQASTLLLADLDAVLAALRRRAFEQKGVVAMGRSHGIHAEPVTMGLKLATFHAAFARARARLARAALEVATCAISGAVGTFANIDPRVEAAVAKRLGLTPEPISTQVIPRDRHAAFMSALALVGAEIEHLATEVRHLQRTEVGEAEELFAAGQKGSSAMPHKRNPVLSENLTGIARLIRAAVIPALENVTLWHERDISHSSVERVSMPDTCILADFALHRLATLVERLVFSPEAIRRNLELTQGLHASQRVLLALTESGLPRQEAYALVQRNAMLAFSERRPFLDFLKQDAEVTSRLPPGRLESLFDLGYHTRHVDLIFARVFGEGASA